MTPPNHYRLRLASVGSYSTTGGNISSPMQLLVNVARSSMSDGSVLVDGLRVYCKSKESFGFPLEEAGKFVAS